MTEYEDFELSLFTGEGGVPWVRLDSRTAGQARIPVRLSESVQVAQGVRLPFGARAGTRDLSPGNAPPDAEELGAQLYDALFADGIGRGLAACRAARPDSVVRISLQYDLGDRGIQALAALPWELLRDRTTNTPLVLSRDVTLVRHIDLSRPMHVPPFAGPLRILFAMSNVQKDLDLAAERDLVVRQLSAHAAEITADFHDVGSHAELEERLHRGRYHVLHFMGHGDFKGGEGGLLLGDTLYSGADLALTIGRCMETRLVVLNACRTAEIARLDGQDPFEGVATALVQQGVAAVVAMQEPILDEAAALFAERLYLEIAHRSRLEAAVDAARQRLWSQYRDLAICATPVLFMRTRDDVFAEAAVTVESVYDRKDVPSMAAFMVDRDSVRDAVLDGLAVQNERGLPLIAIAHGAGEASFDMLVERMREAELPRFFAREAQWPKVESYHLRWPDDADAEGLHRSLSARIVGAVAQHGHPPIDEVRACLAAFPTPPLFSSQLDPQTWQRCGGRAGLDAFLRYWAGWPRAPAGPRVVVLVGINYAPPAAERRGLLRWFRPRELPVNDDIAAALDDLGRSPRDDLILRVLPELGRISVKHAVDWALSAQRPELGPPIRQAFREYEAAGKGDTLSMDEATALLETLLTRDLRLSRGAA